MTLIRFTKANGVKMTLIEELKAVLESEEYSETDEISDMGYLKSLADKYDKGELSEVDAWEKATKNQDYQGAVVFFLDGNAQKTWGSLQDAILELQHKYGDKHLGGGIILPLYPVGKE